jgi:hypothetical protein
MTHYSDDDFDIIGSTRQLVTAAGLLARLDERLKLNASSDDVFYPSALRNEAVSIAALEGSLVRMESLSRLLGDREATKLDRSTRLAADVHDALAAVMEWGREAPDEDRVRKVFDISDMSAGRKMKADLEWVLSEDAHWLHSALLALSERPNPWDAFETLRVLWTSNKFLGTGKRMALLSAGWIVMLGFGCDKPVLGLASIIAKDVDSFRDASQDRDGWIAHVSAALSQIGSGGIKRLDDGEAGKVSMLALCPPGKSSSSVERAIEYMMRHPVFTAKSLAEALDLTPRGAKVVLDKLEEANVIEVEGGLRNRRFVCRRAM